MLLQLDPSKVTKEHLRVLQQMIERDPMHDHHEQEKEMIWQLRHECREHFPQSLPKLLTCVHWANRIDVAIVSHRHCLWCRRWPRAGDRKQANLLASSLARVVPGSV